MSSVVIPVAETAIRDVAAKYGCEHHFYEEASSGKIKIAFIYHRRIKYQVVVIIDPVLLLGLQNTAIYRYLYEDLENRLHKELFDLGAEVTGNYPIIRAYADANMNITTGHLLFYPEKGIPGFVFVKFKSNKNYPEPYSEKERNKNRKKPNGVLNPQPSLLDENEGEDVAKKVIVQKKKIDPSKVRKPLCPLHKEAMKYDPVEAKWRCTTEGCNLVARPKESEESKSVRLGKGGTSLRVIAQQGDDGFSVRVIAMSDDNLALDITDWVNVYDLLRNIDAVELSQAALESGRDSAYVPVSSLMIETGFTLMGTDIILEMHKQGRI